MTLLKAISISIGIYGILYFMIIGVISISCRVNPQNIIGLHSLFWYSIILGWWISILGNPYIEIKE